MPLDAQLSARIIRLMNTTQYAINYVVGHSSRVLVVSAGDRDAAYDKARSDLVARRLFSASLQGSCRPASQDDIDAARSFCGGCGARLGAIPGVPESQCAWGCK